MALPDCYIPPFPHLHTLTLRPSWVNCHGHVDRSACVELSVRQVCHCCLGDEWKEARTGSGRAMWGRFTVPVTYINGLQRRRLPRRLNGDYRPLAMAMRQDPLGRYARPSKSKPAKNKGAAMHRPDDRMPAPGPDHGLPSNPNRGGCCTKQLGLDPYWTQAISVERWVQFVREPGQTFPGRKNQILTQRTEMLRGFLVCPGCAADGGPRDAPRQPPPTEMTPQRIASLSARQRAKQGWSAVNPTYNTIKDKGKPCHGPVRRRVGMLLLPLATPQELKDAAVAQAWIQRYQELFPNTFNSGPGGAFWAKLIERYGMLFSPRRFVCQHCLGVRFGVINVKRLPPSRRGFFANRPVATRPKVKVPKPTVIPRSVRRIDRLAKKARRAIKVADIWMARLAALEAETNPARALDLIMRYYVNPINKRAHPLKNVRWCKSLEPYRKKKRTDDKT